jgi:hypothetical protein
MGEWENGRMGEWENGRMGEWENGRMFKANIALTQTRRVGGKPTPGMW